MQSAVPGNGQPNEVRVWTRVQATCTHDARCRAGTCADLTRYARVESDGAAEAGMAPRKDTDVLLWQQGCTLHADAV
jgi:hypothetical protein